MQFIRIPKRELLRVPGELLARLRFGKQSPIPYWAFSYRYNFGDLVGPYLIEKISGRPSTKSFLGFSKHLIAAGSILSECTNRSIVWGAGFISEKSRLKGVPEKIYAVRGPLTLKRLMEYHININPVLGDPAVCLPHFYHGKQLQGLKKIGIVLHYEEKFMLDGIGLPDDVKLIDIQQGVEDFIDDISGCSVCFSSSLHGLIAADAYKIPNKWIRLSRRLVGGQRRRRPAKT